MKRTEIIEVQRIYCEICNKLCHSYVTLKNNGIEHHACTGYCDETGQSHSDLLLKQLHLGAAVIEQPN